MTHVSTFSQKLNESQINYPITDEELLGIVESLKHFRNIIYGAEILVRTNHKNICHKNAKHTSQRVFWQRILISQEYEAKIEYYAGKNYTGADGLSRLRTSNTALNSSQAEIYALEPITNCKATHFPLDL